MNDNNNPSNLHVPQSSSHSSTGVRSIMDAYASQSKVQLFDENTAMSSDDISGVKGKNIPLSALRPKTTHFDENGKPVYSKSQIAEDMERRADIMKAYRKMQGVEEEDDNESSNGLGSIYDEEGHYNNLRDNLSEKVQEAEIEYIEDVPDDNEGLLHYLETCITNAEANLEMLKSLYAALRS